jgi:hypothetical protein
MRDLWLRGTLQRPAVQRVSFDRSDVTFTTGAKNLKLASQYWTDWEMIPTDVSTARFIPIECEDGPKRKRGAEAPRLACASEAINSLPPPEYRAGVS